MLKNISCRQCRQSVVIWDNVLCFIGVVLQFNRESDNKRNHRLRMLPIAWLFKNFSYWKTIVTRLYDNGDVRLSLWAHAL